MNLSDLTLDRDGLIAAIECTDPAFNEALRQEAYRVKVEHIGTNVYLRGLIEISNICAKNCLYCGIRSGNTACQRYELSEEEVLASAKRAALQRYGSVVIQGGERTDSAFIKKITRLVKAIKALETKSDGGRPLGITLSLGEQPREVYQEWFDAGAHRYLLRIESSNPDLYRKIHPQDARHSYDRRIRALQDLKEMGWQAGTGAMIALLRLLMPDINIASATALEVLHPRGRELGILAGANIIMPNVTPEEQMVKYNLYDRKTLLRDCPNPDEAHKGENHICKNCVFPFCTLGDNLKNGKITVGFGQWGDSKHFKNK